MIMFEYFRFETWIQQSGFLSVDGAGSPKISIPEGTTSASGSLRRRHTPTDKAQIASSLVTGISAIHHVLKELGKLTDRYHLGMQADGPNVPKEPVISPLPACLLQNAAIVDAISDTTKERQRRAKRVSFFKKVNFAWAITDNTSDRNKISNLIGELTYWNDGLREMLPLDEQRFGDALLTTRALDFSDQSQELRIIGDAASKADYQDISKSSKLKLQKLETTKDSLTAAHSFQSKLQRQAFSRLPLEGKREITSYTLSTCLPFLFERPLYLPKN